MDPAALADTALRSDDAAAMGRLLAAHHELRLRINEPSGPFKSPAILRARSRAMLDVLLEAGADINVRSDWWAGGFGLLDTADTELAMYAIERGATLTPHAAARLGLLPALRTMVEADPEVVRARGGDGQTPLHFAATLEIAAYLLDHGADIDARDIDHDSTPAQYMLGRRSAIAAYLVERGCRTDILMAAALGDVDLVNRHLDENPESIRMRVSDEHFPMVGGSNGGTIYQWQLGRYVSAAQVARRFDHPQVFDVIFERSPDEERLLNACWLGDEARVRSLLAGRPQLAAVLPAAGRRHAAHAARNNDTTALRSMLAAGLPVDPSEATSQHRASALHWAAWHGNAEAVRLILLHHPPLDDVGNDFKGTPLGWARHGRDNSWDRATGDYEATVALLITAGAPE